MMALINIKQVHDDKAPVNSSYWVAIFTLALYTLSTILITVVVCIKPKYLLKHSMTRRCGFIYLPYHFEKPTKGNLASVYPALNTARMFVLAITIMYASHLLVTQILVFCLSTIFIMSWVGIVGPFREPGANSRQLVYEFSILLVTNFLLTSSNAAIDLDARPMIGWLIIFVVDSLLLYS